MEFLLAEWHIPPDYIVANWTEELLSLMIEKLSERKKQQQDAFSPRGRAEISQRVTDDQLFRMLEGKLKVVKLDGN